MNNTKIKESKKMTKVEKAYAKVLIEHCATAIETMNKLDRLRGQLSEIENENLDDMDFKSLMKHIDDRLSVIDEIEKTKATLGKLNSKSKKLLSYLKVIQALHL